MQMPATLEQHRFYPALLLLNEAAALAIKDGTSTSCSST
jgi:hypothetical protein